MPCMICIAASVTGSLLLRVLLRIVPIVSPSPQTTPTPWWLPSLCPLAGRQSMRSPVIQAGWLL